jgi:hypothetical protein
MDLPLMPSNIKGIRVKRMQTFGLHPTTTPTLQHTPQFSSPVSPCQFTTSISDPQAATSVSVPAHAMQSWLDLHGQGEERRANNWRPVCPGSSSILALEIDTKISSSYRGVAKHERAFHTGHRCVGGGHTETHIPQSSQTLGHSKLGCDVNS